MSFYKKLHLLSYVYVQKYHIKNLHLGECTFWSTLPCLDPIYFSNMCIFKLP